MDDAIPANVAISALVNARNTFRTLDYQAGDLMAVVNGVVRQINGTALVDKRGGGLECGRFSPLLMISVLITFRHGFLLRLPLVALPAELLEKQDVLVTEWKRSEMRRCKIGFEVMDILEVCEAAGVDINTSTLPSWPDSCCLI